MTGWIPDFSAIPTDTSEREELFNTLFYGFHSGNCVVSVGTEIKETVQGFMSDHAYAVLDMQTYNVRLNAFLLLERSRLEGKYNQ